MTDSTGVSSNVNSVTGTDSGAISATSGGDIVDIGNISGGDIVDIGNISGGDMTETEGGRVQYVTMGCRKRSRH
jgi:hypothetical protein